MRLADLYKGAPDDATKAQLQALIAQKSVQDGNGCWVWQGNKTPQGYGWVSHRGRSFRAHRLSFELFRGEIPHPSQLVLDHLCRNRACCNPDHLECVTNRENLMRGNGVAAAGARQTHCAQGHSFETYGARRANGYRWCKECQRIRDAKRNKRIRAADTL